jgi:hypothetical protein
MDDQYLSLLDYFELMTLHSGTEDPPPDSPLTSSGWSDNETPMVTHNDNKTWEEIYRDNYDRFLNPLAPPIKKRRLT